MSKALNRTLRAVTKHQDLLVTPSVEQFLRERGDIVLDDVLAQRLVGLVTAHPRDRSASWSASSRGLCLRKQALTYIGVPARANLDVILRNLFNDGTWRHLRWQMMLMLAGTVTDVEVPLYSDEYNLMGSADAVNHPLAFGVELKGTSRMPDAPMPLHVRQIHTYMILLEFDRFALVYESKFNQDWREYIIEADPKIMADVKMELTYLNQCAVDRVLPPVQKECRHGSGDQFTQCQFRHVCLGCRDWDQAEAIAAGIVEATPPG